METGKVSSPTSTGATAAASGVDRAGLQQAAKAFEAIFMRQMTSSMRSAKLGEDLLGSSASNKFRYMADARVADGMAENGGGFGIASMLLTQFEPKPRVIFSQTVRQALIPIKRRMRRLPKLSPIPERKSTVLGKM